MVEQRVQRLGVAAMAMADSAAADERNSSWKPELAAANRHGLLDYTSGARRS